MVRHRAVYMYPRQPNDPHNLPGVRILCLQNGAPREESVFNVMGRDAHAVQYIALLLWFVPVN
jgi:hypothetical protein